MGKKEEATSSSSPAKANHLDATQVGLLRAKNPRLADNWAVNEAAYTKFASKTAGAKASNPPMPNLTKKGESSNDRKPSTSPPGSQKQKMTIFVT